MNKIPFVTVIIANHNYAHYLGTAIQSAFAQSYPNLGICIIDDGSTDNSWEVISSLFDGNENVKQISEDITVIETLSNNRKVLVIKSEKATGPSNARNIAIELTQNVTDFYMILDADDIMAPLKTQKFVEKFLLYPDVAVVYADYDILNVETGNLIREYKHTYSFRHLRQDCIVHSNAGIRKTALLEVKDNFGYYDINLRCAEDYDLWLRLSEKYSIAHIPESLSLVRNHQNNSSFSVKQSIWQSSWQRVQDKIKFRNNS